MSWFGKIMGGALGFVAGGPLGAIAGATVGHVFFDKTAGHEEYSSRRLNRVEQIQAAYFISLFSVLGKFAKIDGVVTRDELALIDNFMRHMGISGTERNFAITIFNEARNSTYSINDFANQLYEVSRHQRALLYSFIDLLFQLALSDGKVHHAEEAALDDIRHIFGINDTEFNSIKARYIDDSEKYYKVLNCTSDSTDEEIKKQYKKLAKDFHPDTITGKGLPEEFVTFATRRFQEIQEAYEKIRKKRRF
ncbi:MAG: TerB family tellurite resistance protein [Proteobacteria bacterium]|nr:TerB family tellurite resistance protein [Pseudomonadota bacterium]